MKSKIKTLLTITFWLIVTSTYSQTNTKTILEKLKVAIEKDTIKGYQGIQSRFNPCIIKLDYNKKGEIQISRIKLPEANFSDLTNDKEIRTVKLNLLDANSINIDSTAFGFKFKILTISREKEVEFKLFKNGEETVIMNEFINLGIYREPNARAYLNEIAKLFKDAILASQKE